MAARKIWAELDTLRGLAVIFTTLAQLIIAELLTTRLASWVRPGADLEPADAGIFAP